MDFLLVLLYIIFIFISVSPFAWIYFKDQKGIEVKASDDEMLSFKEKRRLLMDNLRDLKMEFDTGKLTPAEFSELSESIVLELKAADEKIDAMNVVKETQKNLCQCGYVITIIEARFCPSCGTKLRD